MQESDKIKLEELHKELELIQNCIARMANNSFMLKEWFVALGAVVIAMTLDKSNKTVIIGTLLLVTVAFWYLDAFFLRIEKMYRKLYNWVLEERRKNNREFQYNLEPHRFDNEVEGILKIMFSTTLLNFYGVAIIVIVLIGCCL